MVGLSRWVRQATSQAERLLRDGKPLAFTGDQDAGRKEMFVDFFREPA